MQFFDFVGLGGMSGTYALFEPASAVRICAEVKPRKDIFCFMAFLL